MISQLAGAHWRLAIELARATPNLHLELSTANIVFAVRLAVHELPTRTLFGSDAPYGDPVVARTTVWNGSRPRARCVTGCWVGISRSCWAWRDR